MNESEKIIIDEEIIAKTECDKNFACLKEGPHIYCRAIDTLGRTMIQLECRDHLKCRHNKIYGALHACNCPVRIEIFKKYAL